MPEAIVRTIGHGPKMGHNEILLRLCSCGFPIYSSRVLWPIQIKPMELDVEVLACFRHVFFLFVFCLFLLLQFPLTFEYFSAIFLTFLTTQCFPDLPLTSLNAMRQPCYSFFDCRGDKGTARISGTFQGKRINNHYRKLSTRLRLI